MELDIRWYPNFDKMKKAILLLVFLTAFSACKKSDDPQDPVTIDDPQDPVTIIEPFEGSTGKLLFSSGFESDTYLSEPSSELEISNWPDYEIIRGTDASTGYSWPISILGSNFAGIHKVDDDGGAALSNDIETVIGHNGEETTALFQSVNYDIQFTQTPYQINNITENPEELYMSYRMKTDDTALVGPDKWRAIWEYKTDDYASYANGFRMIALMVTDNQGTPHWVFQGDTSPTSPVWQVENYDVPVIMNAWFKVEYYIKWSDAADGYASMKVNGQLIAEHYGATTTNSDNLDFIILTQVYGNSHPMHQWVDDIEIWDGVPN